MKRFERVISRTQSQYKLQKEKKFITQQCSYNLPIELEEYLKELNAINRISPLGDDTNVLYELNNEYKINLSHNIICIIGAQFNNNTNKVVFTHTEEKNGKTPKFQLKKTDFAKFGKEYEWFVELYTKNYEGVNFVIVVDEIEKIIKFDVEFSPTMFNGDVVDENDFTDSNFYGMHIKNTNTCLSEEYPHICLGWGLMGDLSNCNSKDDLEVLHSKNYPNKNQRSRSVAVSMINLFRFEMKENDIVVYFDGKNANIGKVTSNYYYNLSYQGDSSDYGSKRDVVWLKSIEYSKLDYEFKKRASVAKSIYSLNVFKSYILDLLNDIDANIDDSSDEYLFDKNITEDELKKEFQEWLTTYSNPDYTGKEKYTKYDYSLCRLISKGHELGYFDISNILELNLYNIDEIQSLYEENDELKEFDKTKNQANAGIAALKKFRNFLNWKSEQLYDDDYVETEETQKINKSKFDFNCPNQEGRNLVVYGTPGCGKSYYVQHELLKYYAKEEGTFKHVVRTTFFQDYTNTDFVGQIMPHVDGDKVSYLFIPGPFTSALDMAIKNPNEPVALVIEELNRGNAASIFGDIFQLLDRENGASVYEISNINIQQYLEKENPNYIFNSIKLPSNLSIFATMNTSDQNVFTLDTAFKRRWKFEKMKNDFIAHPYKGSYIPGMDMTIEEFTNAINNYILNSDEFLNSEDKQLGVYFFDEKGLRKSSEDFSTEDLRKDFAYKVLEYLWDDVAKYERDRWFNNCKSLDDLIDNYVKAGKNEIDDPSNDGRVVFAKDIFNN